MFVLSTFQYKYEYKYDLNIWLCPWHRTLIWYQRKVLTTGNTHCAEWKLCHLPSLKVRANISFSVDKQTHKQLEKQTKRQTGHKLYAPNLSIMGHKNTQRGWMLILYTASRKKDHKVILPCLTVKGPFDRFDYRSNWSWEPYRFYTV